MNCILVALCLTGTSLLAALPNDPLLRYDPARRINYAASPASYVRDEYQWGLVNTAANTRAYFEGSPGGVDARYDEPVGEADISAEGGWGFATDARACRVALIDLGVDLTHPDLTNNVVENVVLGAATHVVNPHATAVASVLCAEGNNGIGMAGVAWRASLVCIETGYREAAIAEGIDLAIARGCRIICLPWGTAQYFDFLEAACKRAEAAGVLIICSTLNDPSDMDSHAPDYPGSFGLSNVIVVTSSTRSGELYSWAARGRHSVHLAAPGRAVPVCAPVGSYGGSYHYWSGTSFAAPHVAGALALLWASHPELTAAQVKERLLVTVDRAPAYADTVSGGTLNLQRLLQPVVLSLSPLGLSATLCPGSNVLIEQSDDLAEWRPWLTVTKSGQFLLQPPASGNLFFRGRHLSREESENRALTDRP